MLRRDTLTALVVGTLIGGVAARWLGPAPAVAPAPPAPPEAAPVVECALSDREVIDRCNLTGRCAAG